MKRPTLYDHILESLSAAEWKTGIMIQQAVQAKRKAERSKTRAFFSGLISFIFGWNESPLKDGHAELVAALKHLEEKTEQIVSRRTRKPSLEPVEESVLETHEYKLYMSGKRFRLPKPQGTADIDQRSPTRA